MRLVGVVPPVAGGPVVVAARERTGVPGRAAVPEPGDGALGEEALDTSLLTTVEADRAVEVARVAVSVARDVGLGSARCAVGGVAHVGGPAVVADGGACGRTASGEQAYGENGQQGKAGDGTRHGESALRDGWSRKASVSEAAAALEEVTAPRGVVRPGTPARAAGLARWPSSSRSKRRAARLFRPAIPPGAQPQRALRRGRPTGRRRLRGRPRGAAGRR